MSGWMCYIAVNAVQEEEARQVIQMGKMTEHTHYYGDYVLFRFSTQCQAARVRLLQAYIPFVAATYFTDRTESQDSWEVYYDREGACFSGPIIPDENLKTLWYHQIREQQKLPPIIVYRMSHVLSSPNEWGDVKHNTAMARMRQALLS